MSRLWTSALCAVSLICSSASAADLSFRIADRFAMPDGGWDYATSDLATARVFWVRNAHTDIIDTRTNKLTTLKNTGNGHMAVIVPGTTLAVIPMRVPAKTSRIVDIATDTIIAELPSGEAPDGAVFDPFSRHVYVMNHNSSDVTVIDAVGKKVVATIAIGGGKLEFPAADGLGKVFVNIQAAGIVAVIDVKTNAVTARYPMEGCVDASGLAYAGKSKTLIASCANGVAKVLDATNGKELASIAIGKGPDSVVYDGLREIAFIPCGEDGVLEIISVGDRAKIAKIQTLKTMPLARTGAIDPQGRLYLMAAAPDPSKPRGGGGRPTPKDGSFEMLVIAP